MLAITVPQGVRPGQPIRFQTPSGQLMQVAVPAGLGPGMVFQVRDPAASAPPPAPARQNTQPMVCTGFIYHR